MQIFKLSDATAARRYFYLHLVDATDGITPETGEAAGQPQISKNGAAFANTSATLTAIGNGAYYVALTTTELNTLGWIIVRYKSANTAEFQGLGQVVAFDPFDAAALGLTNLDASITSRLAPTVAGRTLDVSAGGEAGVDWANIGSPTTTQALSGTTVKTATDVEADTQDIQSRLPAALVAGRMSSDAVAISGSTAAADDVEAKIGNLNATVSSRSSHSAADVWAVGTRTLTSFGTLVADIWAYSTRTLSAFSTALAVSVWDVLAAAVATANSIGLQLKTNIDAAITTRLAPTVAARTLNIGADGIGESNVKQWQGSAPDSLALGRVPSKVMAMDTDVVTAAALRADAVMDIQSGLATSAEIAALNDLSAAEIEACVDLALDNAIPPEPTPDSVNERLKRLEEDVTPTRAGLLDNLDAAISSRATVTAIWEAAARTLTDKTGFELTTAERTAIGTALLDLTDGIESGVTLRQAIRIIGAVIAGLVSDYPTGPGKFKGLDKATVRALITHDADGNRTAATYTP